MDTIKTCPAAETSHDNEAQQMRRKIAGYTMEYIYYDPDLSDEMLRLITENAERSITSQNGDVNIYSSYALAEAMEDIEKELSDEDKTRLAKDIELVHQVIKYFNYMDMGGAYYEVAGV